MKSIRIIFLLLTLISCYGCNVAQQVKYPGAVGQSGQVVNVTNTISGTFRVKDNATIVFGKNGLLKNATVVGKNIKVVADGDRMIFSNCNFKNATFTSSEVKATHFGMKGDLKSRAYSYKFKGYKINTNERYGTDNTQSLLMLADFLAGSNNIKVVINGDFYTSPKTMFVYIKDATNLEVSGPGTLVMGLRFSDCTNCNVHDMKFVGFHTVHDFPPIYYKEPQVVNGVKYDKNNTYNCTVDGLAACGLGDDAVKFMATKSNSTINRNFRVERCHFEMRQNGVAVGTRSDKLIVRDVVMDDCTFDHVYFQPVALHVTGAKINNVRGSYCLQGLDISAGSNNVTATNCSFGDCCFGPKQESIAELRSMSHHNVIENCTFNITDRYMMLDAAQYILNVSEGPSGDTFTVRNTTFNVKKNRPVTSVMTRAYKTLLENVTINVDAPLDRRSDSQYSMIEMFSVFGAAAFVPQLELNYVTVNIASGTSVYSVVSPHGGPGMNVTARGLTVNGAGKVDNYFENATSVVAQDCSFNMPSKMVASGLGSFSATRCNATVGTNIFVNNTKPNSTINVTNCNIKAQSLVNCRTAPKSLVVNGNTASISGSEAITGVNASQVNSSAFKISGNTFNGNRSLKILNNAAQSKLPSLNKINVVK